MEWLGQFLDLLRGMVELATQYASELLRAWGAWLHPPIPPEMRVLWGVPMIWWSRVGKVMQAFGALMIIFDIVGVTRINAIGNYLRAASSLDGVTALCSDILEFVKAAVRLSVAPARSQRWTAAYERLASHPLLFVFYLLIAFATAMARAVAGYLEPFPPLQLPDGGLWWILRVVDSAFGFYIGWFVGLFATAPVMIGLLIVPTLLAGLVGSVVLKGAGFILGSPRLRIYAGFATLLLLLFGFHFDLLSS
jgi:hypothetical protein